MIIFTKHALERMRERNISKKEVERVIGNPDYLKRFDGKLIANKKFGNKRIEVVFTKEAHRIIIITCYLL